MIRNILRPHTLRSQLTRSTPSIFGLVEGFKLPRLGLTEQGDHLIAQVELAGLKKDNVDISLDHNILSISGFTAQEASNSNSFSSSSFYRSFPVPDGLREDEIKVTLREEEGILKVVIPKVPREPRVKSEIVIELEGGEGGEKESQKLDEGKKVEGEKLET